MLVVEVGVQEQLDVAEQSGDPIQQIRGQRTADQAVDPGDGVAQRVVLGQQNAALSRPAQTVEVGDEFELLHVRLKQHLLVEEGPDHVDVGADFRLGASLHRGRDGRQFGQPFGQGCVPGQHGRRAGRVGADHGHSPSRF